MNVSKKTWFFRDSPTLDGSDFYSTHRGDLDTPLHEKKKIEKKIFLVQERGGPINMYKNNKEIKKSIYSYYRL